MKRRQEQKTREGRRLLEQGYSDGWELYHPDRPAASIHLHPAGQSMTGVPLGDQPRCKGCGRARATHEMQSCGYFGDNHWWDDEDEGKR